MSDIHEKVESHLISGDRSIFLVVPIFITGDAPNCSAMRTAKGCRFLDFVPVEVLIAAVAKKRSKSFLRPGVTV